MKIQQTKDDYIVDFEGNKLHFKSLEEAKNYIQEIEGWLR